MKAFFVGVLESIFHCYQTKVFRGLACGVWDTKVTESFCNPEIPFAFSIEIFIGKTRGRKKKIGFMPR